VELPLAGAFSHSGPIVNIVHRNRTKDTLPARLSEAFSCKVGWSMWHAGHPASYGWLGAPTRYTMRPLWHTGMDGWTCVRMHVKRLSTVDAPLRVALQRPTSPRRTGVGSCRTRCRWQEW